MKEILNYQFLKKLQNLPFVDEIWLFGSRARGDNAQRSDIDLAIICPNAKDSDWIEVMDIVEDADTLLKIDCIRFDENNLSKAFCNNILRDKKIIYMKEIQWKDYFYNLGKALDRLGDVLSDPNIDDIDYMRDATIQRFEFTIELFWKLLKKALFHEKIEATTPRDTLSKAYEYNMIDNEQIWLAMLDDRNNTSHAYKEEQAKIIFEHIKTYYPIFKKTYDSLKEKYNL